MTSNQTNRSVNAVRKPQRYPVAEGLHPIVITKRCTDPVPNEIAMMRWLERIGKYEASLPVEQLAEIPESYVKPYPKAGEKACKE